MALFTIFGQNLKRKKSVMEQKIYTWVLLHATILVVKESIYGKNFLLRKKKSQCDNNFN